MNAAELFTIVKDVPKEAWPPRCYYLKPDGQWSSCSTDDDPECRHDPDHAALMFVGRMVEWLAEHGLYLVPVYHVPGKFGNRGFQLFTSDMKYESVCSKSGETLPGDSLIQALAAACKEVGKQ